MIKTFTRSISRVLGSVGTATLGAAVCLPASVAVAADAGEQIPEIVVSAQKRAQNEQDVPIAITTFTALALQEKNIAAVSDMARLTPNVNLDTASPFGGSNQVLSASIRGIGQDDFGFNLDPGVGVYVDGIYLARTTGANVNLLDVEQVEILKGPQGTLFGRNTIGGAIDVVTRTPGDRFSIKAEATGGSFNRRDLQASVDVPFSDSVLSSFTFSSLNRDGYQRRIPYAASTPSIVDDPAVFPNSGAQTFGTQGGQGENAMRAKILWKAADSLKVTLTADWTHVDESSVPESLLATATNPPGTTPLGSAFGFFYNACVSGHFNPALCNVQTLGGGISLFGTERLPFGSQYITNNPDLSYATGANYDTMDQYGAAATVDWQVDADTHLKSITGYRKLQWSVALDVDASPVEQNQGSFREGQHQVSEELQWTGVALGDALKYSAGLYYFDEQGFERDYVTIGGGLLQISGLNALETESYAAYTHVDWTVADKLTLIAGGRYSYDHKTLSESQPLYVALAAPGGLAFPTTPTGENTQNFSVFTPTLGLQYQFTRDLMAYATYSKGYKDGGWTTRLTAPVPAVPTFGPEKARTYEAGIKSDWLDRTLQVNAAVFYTKYDGIQLNFQQGLSPTIENAGNADIKGVELEGAWIVGGGFSIAATAGYMDAYYTSLQPGINAGQSCAQPYEACITLQSRLPKTPKTKYSVSPIYKFGLANGGSLRLGADFTHTAVMYNDAINTSLLGRPQTNVLNTSLTYASPDDKYEVVAGGTNVTNERFLTTGNQDTTAGIIYGTYDPPAEWYVTGRVKF